MFTEEERILGTGCVISVIILLKLSIVAMFWKPLELLRERAFLRMTNVLRFSACPIQSPLDVLTLFLCCELERGQPRQLHVSWGVVLHPHSTQAFLSLQVPHLYLGIFYP